MVTRFQNWIQKSFCTLIIFLISQESTAQPYTLESELQVNSGINANNIRVIQKDIANCIWVGTDHGLQVLNDCDSVYKNITAQIGDRPVWALTFYKNFAFIGTRFNGVYVYDLTKNKVSQYFDSASTGLARRFRLINDTVFLATKSSPVYFVFDGKRWVLRKIISSGPQGYATDFVRWNNLIYTSFYSHLNYQLRTLNHQRLDSTKEIILTDKYLVERNSFSLVTNDSILFVGGDGYYSIVDKSNNARIKPLRHPITKKYFPVWDAVYVKSRPMFTVGNPDNSQEGMIFTDTSMDITMLHPNFYGQCLYYDSLRYALWAGTLNRGLFYWPFAEFSYNITSNYDEEFYVYPITNDSIILFNKDVIILKLINQSTQNVLYKRVGSKIRDTEIYDVAYNSGYIFVLFNNHVERIDLKTRNGKAYSNFAEVGTNSKIHVEKDFIYLFSIYTDNITKINISSGNIYNFKAPSNHVSLSNKIGDKIVYHSVYTGFHVFDSVSHSLNLSFPIIESFTVAHDTLWILSAGKVHVYKLNLNEYSCKLLFESDFKGKIPGFIPLWLVNISGSLYCGNNQGFLRLSHLTGNPESYTYLGNYSRGVNPTIIGDFIFFHNQNYITRLPKDVIEKLSFPYILNAETAPLSQTYQWTSFSIKFKSNENIALHHSLKSVEFWESGLLKSTFYTLADHVDFISGINSGDYLIKIYSNNQLVKQFKLKVSIPLASNPFFYIVISLFVVFFFFMIFKYLLSKRNYERNLLDNRLQLLKQNLNPHFIFNSLNLIYSLVLQKKNEAAIRTINNFSDLHRYYLDNINKQKIPITDELFFIESYLKMESERVEIDDPFVYELPVGIGKTIAEKEVPPMILQPLIENAVKYSANDGNFRKIWIDFQSNGENIVVGIENTIGKEKTSLSGKGLGLKLVQERIEIYNKTFKEKIDFNSNVQCRHTESSYRCELIFPI